MADPPVLWTPPDELVDVVHDDPLHALGVRRARAAASTTYEDLWQWSVDDLEAFWSSIWTFFDVTADAAPMRVLGSREMPGAEWFPGVELSYAEHVFRGKDDDEVAILFDGEGREAGQWTWGELRAQTARARAGPEAPRRGPRRPRRRLHRQRARRRSPPSWPRRRWARSGRAARPTSACAPSSTASRRSSRRSCSPSTATTTAASTSTSPTSSRSCARSCRRSADTVDPRAGLVRRRGAGRADLRARAVRPPAVGPLLQRHDRPAEGDRARAGRDPARAPQEAAPAPGRARRRPRVLVHHHGLDDVELPHVRPAHAGGDRALRRQPRLPGHGPAVGPRRADADDDVRDERRLPARLHEGGRRAGRGPRPQPRCAPSARPARRCRPRASSGSTTSSARRRGCSRPPAGRTSARPSWAARRSSPSSSASCSAARWAPRSRPSTRRATRSSTRSASS